MKTDMELKAYIEAQQQSFIEVSKKVRSLEEENQKLLNKIKTMESQGLQERNLLSIEQGISNSEIICLVEIEKLKNTTEIRELTKDESQKFDTYQKILTQINAAKKKGSNPLDNVSSEDLLKLIDGGKSNG